MLGQREFPVIESQAQQIHQLDPLDPLDLQSLELSARTWLSQVRQKMPASESGRLRGAMSMCPIQRSKFGDMAYYVMIRRQFRFNHCWLIYPALMLLLVLVRMAK